MFASGGHAQEGFFATPMWMRGQPVWVTPVSRRQLLLQVAERNAKPKQEPKIDVAVVLL